MESNYRLYLNDMGMTKGEQDIIVDYIRELFEITMTTYNNTSKTKNND